jgi:DNA (cytosine-5)-methyltransferase 1
MKIIELFAGIGSQTTALKNIDIEHEVVGISEWNIPALISYNALHGKNENCNLSKELILEELKEFTFSTDGKKPCNLNKISLDKLQKLYVAHKNTKNLGSILDLNSKDFPNHDLLTYSSPCTNISNQGKQEGLYDGKYSSMLWEVGRILNGLKKENRLPKYLLMENVAAILNNKNSKGFNEWKLILEQLGYKNWDFALTSSYFNIPQNRKRAYMVSILNGNDDDFIIPNQERLTTLTLNNIISDNINEVYNIKDYSKYIPNNIITKKTKNGIESFNLENYTGFVSEDKVYKLNSIAPTITANGAQSRIKVLINNNTIRLLSARECWKLMGFKDYQFDKVKDLITNNELIKQAGNSIVVNVLEKIFTNMFKNKTC